MAGAAAAAVMSADISRRNPQDDYELIQRIGSGTYGDVYKVTDYINTFKGGQTISPLSVCHVTALLHRALITTFIFKFIV